MVDKVLSSAPSEGQRIGAHKIDLLFRQERHANLLDLEVRDESVHIWFALVRQFVQVHGPIGSFEQNHHNVDEFHMTRRNNSNYFEAQEIMPSVFAMCYCAPRLTGLWYSRPVAAELCRCAWPRPYEPLPCPRP